MAVLAAGKMSMFKPPVDGSLHDLVEGRSGRSWEVEGSTEYGVGV